MLVGPAQDSDAGELPHVVVDDHAQSAALPYGLLQTPDHPLARDRGPEIHGQGLSRTVVHQAQHAGALRRRRAVVYEVHRPPLVGPIGRLERSARDVFPTAPLAPADSKSPCAADPVERRDPDLEYVSQQYDEGPPTAPTGALLGVLFEPPLQLSWLLTPVPVAERPSGRGPSARKIAAGSPSYSG